MLVFGHAGITVATAILANVLIGSRNRPQQVSTNEELNMDRVAEVMPRAPDPPSVQTGSSLASALRQMDIRLLAIGSLLPDIIDKPVGLFFFGETFSSGRIFSHTLLFFVLLAGTGLYVYMKQGKTWLIPLAFGTFIHLVLDQMWRTPQTLLWPLFGLHFERRGIEHWLTRVIHGLLTDPAVYVPELVGAAFFISLILVLLRRRELSSLIRYGHIWSPLTCALLPIHIFGGLGLLLTIAGIVLGTYFI